MMMGLPGAAVSVIDAIEDSYRSMHTEWLAIKDKYFTAEHPDPVFEGTVRDFCAYDDALQHIQSVVEVYMKGVDDMTKGMNALSNGMHVVIQRIAESQITADTCKFKEAHNKIVRPDAPHSSVAKLKRDMDFNIINPIRSHVANNRQLKNSLEIRKRRLIELNMARKAFEDAKKHCGDRDVQYIESKMNYEEATRGFHQVDRRVFEWLYILEEYRGDILDSILQTLKYLEYEFFATSAHAISTSLPSRMEFRPMVEMTPEHLEAQVELELQEDEQREGTGRGVGGSARGGAVRGAPRPPLPRVAALGL